MLTQVSPDVFQGERWLKVKILTKVLETLSTRQSYWRRGHVGLPKRTVPLDTGLSREMVAVEEVFGETVPSST